MPIDNGEPPFRMDRIITPETRLSVRSFLDRTCTGDIDDLLRGLPEIEQLVFTAEGDVAGAFAEVLNDGTPLQRAWVAGALLAMSADMAELVTEANKDKCNATLTAMLTGVEPLPKLVACGMLAQCSSLSPAVIKELRELSAGPNEVFSIIASATLARSAGYEGHALGVLKNAMDNADASLVAWACVGLLGMSKTSEVALAFVRQRFPELPSFLKQHFFQAAINLGPDAILIVKETTAVLEDRSVEAGTRQMAARALGAMSSGEKSAPLALLRALNDPEYPVVYGAAQGLAVCKFDPGEVAQTLLSRINDPDIEMRRTIAYAFGLLPGVPERVAAGLIERLGIEPEREIRDLLSMVLVESGSVAIPPLIDIMCEDEPVRAQYAGNILLTMGTTSALAIACRVKSLGGCPSSRSLLSILSSMGRNAKPAVQTLAELLDTTRDDGFALHLISTLSRVGDAVLDAVDALVHRVARHGSEDLGEWALRALFSVRRVAVERLKAEVATASGDAQKFLQHAIDELEPMARQEASLLVGISLANIANFVKIGRVIRDMGPISKLSIAKILANEEKAEQKNGRKSAQGLSDSNIARLLNDLQAALEGKLTTHGDGATKDDLRGLVKGDLTKLGNAFLDQSEAFMSHRRPTA